MSKHANKKEKKLKEHLKAIGSLLAKAGFIMGVFISAQTLTYATVSFYKTHFGWKDIEQSKIDKLSPLETLDYFSEVLGRPVIKKVFPNSVNEYIYRGRGYWVTAYTDESLTVQFMVISACGVDGFFPVVRNNPVGGSVTLGKTPMEQVNLLAGLPHHSSPAPDFTPHYFLRGATAPSYYYDEYYGGNPSRYQTVLSGYNEICGYIKMPKDIDEVLSNPKTMSLSKDQTKLMRKNIVVNSFGVTAPYQGGLFPEGILNKLFSDKTYWMGVSYVDVGILRPFPTDISKHLREIDDDFKNAKPFQTIRLYNY